MEHTEEKELHACCKSNATDTEACTDCTEEKTEEKCCGCHKTKHRSDEEYKKLIHRLNRIEGQIRGIRGMVESIVALHPEGVDRNYTVVYGWNADVYGRPPPGGRG